MTTGQKKLPLNFLKGLIIIALLVALLLNQAIGLNYSKIKEIELLQINIWYWLIAYLSIRIVAFLLHYFVYLETLHRLNRKREIYSFFRCVFTCAKKSTALEKILFLLSPDYRAAYIFKEILSERYNQDRCDMRTPSLKIHHYNGEDIICKFIHNTQEYECEAHQKKRRRKFYILYCNWSNVLLVSMLAILIIFMNPDNLLDNWFKKFIFTFMILHTYSRIIEICYAFYNDVVATRMTTNLNIGERLSTLKRGNRISLAVHSYLEVVLLFTIIYYLNPSILDVEREGSFFDWLMYSLSISAFNFSFVHDFTPFGKFVHISQVFTSIILVVISIANYLGIKDCMSKYEKADWNKGDYI